MPLDEGNRWVYPTSYESLHSNLVFLDSYSRTGSTEWLALGMQDVGGEVLPVLRITQTTSSGTVTTTDCTVRVGIDGEFQYVLERLDDGSPCAAGFLAHVGNGVGRIDPFLPSVVVQSVAIGGIVYPPMMRATGIQGGFSPYVSITLVEGVGLTKYLTFESAASSYSRWPAALRYAGVGGETYGSALDLAESLTPFAAGNEWTYAVESEAPEAPDYVVWQAGEGGVLSVSEVTDGVTALLGQCLADIRAASAATSWVRSVAFTDAPGGTCPTSPAALPRRVRYVPAPFLNGYEVTEVTPDQAVDVGATTLTTSTFSQEYLRYTQEGVYTSSFTVAEGLGVTQFANEEPGSGEAVVQLVYARIGNVLYGENPVATAGDAAPPATEALAVRLGPNPARTATTLRLEGRAGATARVTLLDRLGRRVRTAETVVPGELQIETADLAVGLYVVQIEIDGEALTRRFVVAR